MILNTNRRGFLLCATTATVPVLSGCSDPVSDVTLEPTEISITRNDVWRTNFVALFEISGLKTSESIFGVTAYLLGSDGEVLYDEILGDYSWSELPEENRETVEQDVTFYVGKSEDEVTAKTDEFPFWVGFGYEEFRLTRSAPDVVVKEYAGRNQGPPESDVGSDDWEAASYDEFPAF